MQQLQTEKHLHGTLVLHLLLLTELLQLQQIFQQVRTLHQQDFRVCPEVWTETIARASWSTWITKWRNPQRLRDWARNQWEARALFQHGLEQADCCGLSWEDGREMFPISGCLLGCWSSQ